MTKNTIIISEVKLTYQSRVKASERAKITGSQDAFNIFYDHWDQDIIEHIEEPVELLQEISSLLKPNGNILLTTPRPCVEHIHQLGSKLKLFSNEACQEHETLFDRDGMNNVLEKAGLSLLHYKRFLFGANQLFIVGHKTNS